MFVDVQGIRLLRKIIRPYDSPSLRVFVFSVAGKRLRNELEPKQKRGTHSSSSLASFATPFLRPPISPSSSRARFFFLFASPLLSLPASIPCRTFLSFRSSMRSSKLQLLRHYPMQSPTSDDYKNIQQVLLLFTFPLRLLLHVKRLLANGGCRTCTLFNHYKIMWRC